MTTTEKKWKLAVQSYVAGVLMEEISPLLADRPELLSLIVQYAQQKAWDRAMFLSYERSIKDAEENMAMVPHLKTTYARKIAQYRRQQRRYSNSTRLHEKVEFEMQDAGVLKRVKEIIERANKEEIV